MPFRLTNRRLERPFGVLILALLLVLIAGCAPGGFGAGQGSQRIQVFAAASLSEAFEELGRQFTSEHPDTAVVFNYGGSQALAQQIVHGAKADVFASADVRQMDTVVASGRIRPEAVLAFARNQLVLAFPAENPAGITSLNDLTTPGLRLVLAAPEVPAGGYSLEFLRKAGETQFGPDYQAIVLANVVSYEENVRAVLSKVALGEADAGLVYLTDVLGDQAESVGYLPISGELNVASVYPLARLDDSPNPALAEAFIEFTLSPVGQEILMRYGFQPPPAPEGG